VTVRFIVYGAGAIGGVIGGRLFEHGHDVVLVARGPHLAAILDNGLRVESPSGAATFPIPAVAHASELALRGDDVVVFAMKTQHTADAARALAAVAPPDIPVVSAQNGVENERILLRHFGDVYGICVMCPTGHLEPGVVEAYSAPITGLLDIGRWLGGVDETAATIATALRASSFECEPRTDIARWKYGKLLLNLGNAIEALCGPSERGGTLMRLARNEAIQALTTAGIDFVDRDEDRARRGDLLTMTPIAGRPRGGGSSWQSLQRGTGNIETDYLNGEIVMLGRMAGVDTPVNALLQRRATRAALDGTRPGSVDPVELLAELGLEPENN
jgi:2-dehydropantoate 2-reductase